MAQVVRRFTRTEILYHWAQAVPFLFLLGSGSAMLATHFTDLSPGLRELLRTVHLVTAILQLTLPFLVALAGDTRRLLANAKHALSWDANDLRWLARIWRRLLDDQAELPPVGKLNAGQKLSLLSIMLAIPLMAFSGACIYFWPLALAAWYLHIVTFTLLLPVLAVHLFMACLNPSTRHSLRGITTGFVRRDWAAVHHSAWLRDLLEEVEQ